MLDETIDITGSATRPLDAETRVVIAGYVQDAKNRGWLQADLTRYFKIRDIDFATYKAALSGAPISDTVYHALASLSVVGLPNLPYQPNVAEIRRHIEWLIEPAYGQYDDALFEIAYDGAEGRGPSTARLFDLEQVDEAVALAVARNTEGRNIYIGAALRLPCSKRDCRASAADFYIATAVPIDIDRDYDATRARMAVACEDGLVVTTGLTPQRRSQHWTRLVEPCDDEADFGQAFAGLVLHSGADLKVKDSARIMRLGGTVSFPKDPKKQAAGYCTELTSVSINTSARPSSVDALKALAPADGAYSTTERFDTSLRPQGEGIERDWTGRVKDGREAYWRDLVAATIANYQRDNGADPAEEDIWSEAFPIFSDPQKVDNQDGRWTSVEGQKALRARIQNTIRRLRAGRLARFGLASIETGEGAEEAKVVAARFQERAPANVSPPQQATGGAAPDAEPVSNPFRASAFTGEPPERRWVVDDWIVEGAVNSLYGDGGLGKTLLAQQLACAVSMGVRWLGLPTMQGSVLAVLCEDEEGELHRRHTDIKAAMGFPIGNPFSEVWLWPRVGFDNILVRWDRDGKPTMGPFSERLRAFILAERPAFLILDTLADIYGGNEIDRSQVNYFVKTILGGLIKELAALGSPLTILLLGHPSVAGKSDGRGFSGSSAWNNSVRSRLYLSRPEEGGNDERVLTRGKANYAKSGDETAIRLFFSEGVLHAQNDLDDGDSMLWAAVREVESLVGQAWRLGRPYSARKGHARDIFKVLPGDMQKGGFGPEISRQAIRSACDDNKIVKSESNGKSGYRLPVTRGGGE